MKTKAHHCFLSVGGWGDTDALRSAQESMHLRLGAASKRSLHGGRREDERPGREHTQSSGAHKQGAVALHTMSTTPDASALTRH